MVVAWKAFFANTTVTLDGQPIGGFQTKKEFQQGGQWPLPDGRRLGVQLVQHGLGPVVSITLDGQPLAGSGTHPETQLKAAAGIVFFVGGLTVVLGLLAELAQVEFLQRLGMGWIAVAIGATFLGLGFGVMKRSMAALIVAVALYSVDILLTLVAMADRPGGPVAGIVVKVFLLIGMCQGFGAIRELEAAPKAPAPPPAPPGPPAPPPLS